MKLELLLPVMALVPATSSRSWGGRDGDIAELDNEDPHPLGKWTSTTTTWETIDDTPTDGLISVSTVVFVEHLYTTPGYSTWLNAKSDSWTSTSTTFTTTTVTHIPHIVYSTEESGASKIQLAKRSTVSVTDWVTVTRDPDNPEGTSEAPSSSETLTTPSMGSPETPPSSATAATTTVSLSSSEPPSPDNSSTSASQSPSSTSAVSGAPPITSAASSEESTPTSTVPAESSFSFSSSSSSTSLAAPPAPVTSTAPIPSESLTEPAGPPSSSEPLPPVSSSDLVSSEPTTTTTSGRHHHPSTLETLTTGFSAPISSTLTFILPPHEGTHISEAVGPSSQEAASAAPTLSENLPPSLGEGVSNSVTAPFTLTLTAPPETSTSVRCDDSWCSNDGTSYCMRWDGISGTNSFGIVTPGEVFTTIGLCTKTVYTQNTQVTTLEGSSPVPAVTRLRPGSDRMRLA
ncbi:hypothetical protein LA080_013258 [Diaporthe eres]|nr:hypothetical protein LA080_013258 [Diaporthe eres]